MSVVGPIAAKKLQGRECSEVPDRTHALQENSLVISIKSSTQTDTSCHSHWRNGIYGMSDRGVIPL
jgi:hypothetical protein